MLALAALGTVIITVLIPHLPFAAVLGFGIVPPHFYPILALIIFAYIAVAEATKILSIVTPFRRDHRPDADLCALELRSPSRMP